MEANAGEGRRVTGFTNSEEAAVGLTEVVPFLLEDELTALGARFEKTSDWGEYVVTDGLLITGPEPGFLVSRRESAARNSGIPSRLEPKRISAVAAESIIGRLPLTRASRRDAAVHREGRRFTSSDAGGALRSRLPRRCPMCRFLAYRGEPVLMSDLVCAPAHSLVQQSLHAHEAKTETNGDGFGLGWYGERETPGVYREVRPGMV
jgi:hypothetical protein